MRDALFLAREDLRHYFRHPQVWIWVFVMPLLLTYLIGSLMAVAFRPGADHLAIYSPPNAGFLADAVAGRLKDSGYEVAPVQSADALRAYPLRLEIPENFTAGVLAGRKSEVRLTCRNATLFAEYDRFRVNRAVLGMLADVAVLSGGARTPTAADFTALAAEPRTIKLHEVSAGESKKIVLGFQQSAPGFIVMFTLLVSFTAGGALLAAERRLGILRRLASSPISRAAVVTGKFGSRFVLGLIQMSFAMLFAKWLFGVNWGGSRVWAVLRF